MKSELRLKQKSPGDKPGLWFFQNKVYVMLVLEKCRTRMKQIATDNIHPIRLIRVIRVPNVLYTGHYRLFRVYDESSLFSRCDTIFLRSTHLSAPGPAPVINSSSFKKNFVLVYASITPSVNPSSTWRKRFSSNSFSA